MVNAQSARPITGAPCLRGYGRADVALNGYLESAHGRTPCVVRDLSLGGARIETEQSLSPDQSIWLSVRKLRIFGNVKWLRGNLAGIQFEEKLPKSIVLNLRGEVVDPEVLAEMEAMLAAQNWVIGTPLERPKSMRMAHVLGARGKGLDQPLVARPQAPDGFRPRRALVGRSGKWQAAAIIALSVAMGLLTGLASIFIF